MPLTGKKIISILLEEAEKVDERCRGYRKEIVELMADIVDLERQHRVQGINIQQKIGDKCNALGQLLAERRGSKGRNQ